MKYPRTFHLPDSPGLGDDDKRLPSLGSFAGKRVIATEKMDGEGTTMTRAATYPRSPDGRSHPSRNWMKAHHGRKARDIPPDWRISGEYMYARHSLAYTRAAGNPLSAFFLGFGVWDESNCLMEWDQTMEVFHLLDIVPVKVLYDGPFDPGLSSRLAQRLDPERQEGFVVRDAGRIPYPEGTAGEGKFLTGHAKWVRAKHVQTDRHWADAWRDEPEFRNELMQGVSPIP